LKYLSFLSHDLSNNLSSVTLMLKLLRLELQASTDFAASVQTLDDAQTFIHDTMAGMRRLLDHARLRKGDVVPQMGSVDIRAFIETIVHQFAAMTEAFDVTRQVIRTPVFFASDFSDVARPIAIDGTREMIDRGYHREAMFWIAATYARCQRVLATDASLELQDRFSPDFEHMLRDLGVVAYDDLYRRADEVRAYLPRLWEVAEQIMDSNLAIEV